MVRWTITAGTAFAVGLAAGVVVGQGLPGSAELKQSQPHKLAIKPPKMADAGPSAKPAAHRIRTVVAASEDHGLPSPVTAERLPVANVIIIRPSKPVAAEKAQRRVAAKPATVQMARAGSPESVLHDNPIVKRELTRDIQRELYRAGCRSVVVSGSWDHRTVKASARFVANSNATLPADRPDVVLLGLLRSYQGRACGLSLAATRGDAATTAALTPAAASLLATNPTISGAGLAPERIGIRQSSPRSAERSRRAARQARRRRAALQRKKRNSWRQQLYGFSLE